MEVGRPFAAEQVAAYKNKKQQAPRNDFFLRWQEAELNKAQRENRPPFGRGEGVDNKKTPVRRQLF
jgi:hypothetical protein